MNQPNASNVKLSEYVFTETSLLNIQSYTSQLLSALQLDIYHDIIQQRMYLEAQRSQNHIQS